MEVEYFAALLELGVVPETAETKEKTEQVLRALRQVYADFTEADAQKVKDIEKVQQPLITADRDACASWTRGQSCAVMADC